MRVKHLVAVFCLAGILSCYSNFLFGDPLNNWHWRNPLQNESLYGITFANGEFYAAGAGGVVLISSDGTNWNYTTTATTSQLNDIIYADGKFVAAGNSGVLETSTDGVHWTLQNSGTTSSLGSLAYGNGKFVAVGGNAVISSSDGVNWFPAISGLSGAGKVAGSGAGFVAINGSTNAYSSSDGLNWTYHPLLAPPGGGFIYPLTPLYLNIVTFENGSFLIGGYKWMGSEQANLCIYSSNDGNNWSLNVAETNYTVEFGLNFFITGSTNVIAGGFGQGYSFLDSSTDGLNWSQIYNIAGAGNAGTYGNGIYVVVQSSQGIYTSPDLVNWSTNSFASPTANFNSVAFSHGTYVVASSSSFVVSTNELIYAAENNTPALSSVITYSNAFVAVGPAGAIYQSTNGFTWTAQNSSTANDLYSVTAAGGLLVAVGEGGTMVTSPSGSTWTSQNSGTVLSLYGVTYSNGLYVAVGAGGKVDTSPDAVNWTVGNSGVRTNLLAVTYGPAGFLAAGLGGTILTSTNGTGWTAQKSGTSSSLESACSGSGYYLVTGTGGVVLTSPDGATWTKRNVGAAPVFDGSAFLNGRFDIVGEGGAVVESDPVPPLLALQIFGQPPQNVFKIFATQGMNYRIVGSANLMGPWSTLTTVNNAPPIAYWTNSAALGNQYYFRVVSP
jgi:hypothetical protein